MEEATILTMVKQAEKVNEFLKPFIIDEEKSAKIKAIFEKELELGLKHGLKESSLQMENTYVMDLTNGKEEGQFLALDLGGTNFRVMLLEMHEGRDDYCIVYKTKITATKEG